MAALRYLVVVVVALMGCNTLVGNETIKYSDKGTEVTETVDPPGSTGPDTPITTDPPSAEDASTEPPVGDDEDAGFYFGTEGGI